MEIHVREQRLPGIGHRYELTLDLDRRLTVVVQDAGRRELGLLGGRADQPEFVLSLTQEQAVALAALLSGARFAIDSSDDDRIDADEVVVETVTLRPGSPAVGRSMKDIRLAGDKEATVLAVIRDETTELVEDEASQPCQPGDRVVIAARRQHLGEVVHALAG